MGHLPSDAGVQYFGIISQYLVLNPTDYQMRVGRTQLAFKYSYLSLIKQDMDAIRSAGIGETRTRGVRCTGGGGGG